MHSSIPTSPRPILTSSTPQGAETVGPSRQCSLCRRPRVLPQQDASNQARGSSCPSTWVPAWHRRQLSKRPRGCADPWTTAGGLAVPSLLPEGGALGALGAWVPGCWLLPSLCFLLTWAGTPAHFISASQSCPHNPASASLSTTSARPAPPPQPLPHCSLSFKPCLTVRNVHTRVALPWNEFSF